MRGGCGVSLWPPVSSQIWGESAQNINAERERAPAPAPATAGEHWVDARHTASLIHNLSARLWRYDTLHSLPARGSSQLNVNVHRNAIDIFLSSRWVQAAQQLCSVCSVYACSYALVDIAISQMSPRLHWRTFISAVAEAPWQSSCWPPIFCGKSAHLVSNLRSLWVTLVSCIYLNSQT